MRAGGEQLLANPTVPWRHTAPPVPPCRRDRRHRKRPVGTRTLRSKTPPASRYAKVLPSSRQKSTLELTAILLLRNMASTGPTDQPCEASIATGRLLIRGCPV